jgi:hypothetical protein
MEPYIYIQPLQQQQQQQQLRFFVQFEYILIFRLPVTHFVGLQNIKLCK